MDPEKKEIEPAEPTEPIEPIEPVEPAEPAGSEQKDPNIYDEDGVPWKNRAKELERKYYKTIEESKNVQNTAPVQSAPQPSFEETELTPEIYQQFKPSDWEDVLVNYGFESDTPGARNAVIRMHNANARSLRLEKELGNVKNNTVESDVFSSVDPDILDEVKSKVKLMNPDKSDMQVYRQCVNMAIAAVNQEQGTDYKAIESRVRAKMEEDKKIKANQPEVNSKSVVKKQAKPLSEEQRAIADRYGMKHDEYYDKLPVRSRIG